MTIRISSSALKVASLVQAFDDLRDAAEYDRGLWFVVCDAPNGVMVMADGTIKDAESYLDAADILVRHHMANFTNGNATMVADATGLKVFHYAVACDNLRALIAEECNRLVHDHP